jgi:hypothetical protein
VAAGRRMAIVNSGEARGRMFRFPFDPSSGALSAVPEALVRHPAPALSPHPSPDGRLLVYTALRTRTLRSPESPSAHERRSGPRGWSPDGETFSPFGPQRQHGDLDGQPDGAEPRRSPGPPTETRSFLLVARRPARHSVVSRPRDHSRRTAVVAPGSAASSAVRSLLNLVRPGRHIWRSGRSRALHPG